MSRMTDTFIPAFDLLRESDKEKKVEAFSFESLQNIDQGLKYEAGSFELLQSTPMSTSNNENTDLEKRLETLSIKPQQTRLPNTRDNVKYNKGKRGNGLQDYSKVKFDYGELNKAKRSSKKQFEVRDGKLQAVINKIEIVERKKAESKIPVDTAHSLKSNSSSTVSNKDLNNKSVNENNDRKDTNFNEKSALNIKKHQNKDKISKVKDKDVSETKTKSVEFDQKSANLIKTETDHEVLKYSLNEVILDAKTEIQLITKATKKGKKINDSRKSTDSSYYSKHLDPESLKSDIEKGLYFSGKLRISSFNRKHGYVVIDGRKDDIFIMGVKHYNRALEGDDVIIKLLTQEEKEKLFKGNNDVPKSIIERDLDAGEVVSIAKQVHSRIFVGVFKEPKQNTKEKTKNNQDLKLDNESSNEEPSTSDAKMGNNSSKNKDKSQQGKLPKMLEFKPFDSRAPLIIVHTLSLPKKYLEDPNLLYKTCFSVKISHWSSLQKNPLGELNGIMGEISKIDCGSNSILTENGVDASDFDEKIISSLPSDIYAVGGEYFENRKDLREKCIFTIDPPTARDLDDAVSIESLEDGLFHVGVHIADVSPFVPQGSMLDLEAKNRATTIYMVERNIPMLPRQLCDELCSLVPHKDRLAFSFTWKIDANGKVLETSYFKSLIRSCAKLSYDQVQKVIDGGHLNQDLVVPQPGINCSRMEENILLLYNLSKKLRTERFDEGSLEMSSLKLSFKLDDAGMPSSCEIYKSSDATRLIEEFMLLANRSVAEILVKELPELAFLRHHPPPNEKGMEELIKTASKYDIDLDISSSQAFQKSLSQNSNPEVLEAFRLLVIRPMQRAKYLCLGFNKDINPHHYALNMPLYTHFTSPIRRYPDLVVHRQLSSLLGNKKYELDEIELSMIANRCNLQKDRSRKVQDQSIVLYLAHFLSTMNKNRENKESKLVEVMEKAKIIDFNEEYMFVVVSKYAIDSRIYFKDLPLDGFKVQEKSLLLKWKDNVEKNRNTRNKSDNNKKDSDTKEEETIVDSNKDNGQLKSIVQNLALLDTIDVKIKVDLNKLLPTIDIAPIRPISIDHKDKIQ
ncbi:RNB-domain-containing protein [Neoconidiobolus thromboides FSU 785]|nr:RNB-domain-containing protein [Neoconidiobolus thromboides FSU 785]